jgi:hypothetical protein
VDFQVTFPEPPWIEGLKSKQQQGLRLSSDETQLLARYRSYRAMITKSQVRYLQDRLAEEVRNRLNESRNLFVVQHCKPGKCIGFRLGMVFFPEPDEFTLKLKCEIRFYLSGSKAPLFSWIFEDVSIYVANHRDPFNEALGKTIRLIDAQRVVNVLGKEKKYNRSLLLYYYPPKSPKKPSIAKKKKILSEDVKVEAEVHRKPDGSTALTVTEKSVFDFIERKPRILVEVDEVSTGKGPLHIDFGDGKCVPFTKGKVGGKDEYVIKAKFNPQFNCYQVDPDNELAKLITGSEGVFDKFYKKYKDKIQFVPVKSGGHNE